MQHDHVLKKLNFDLLTPYQGSGGGGGGGEAVERLRANYLLHCCCCCSLANCCIPSKVIDWKRQIDNLAKIEVKTRP